MMAVRVIWSGRSVWYTYNKVNSWLYRVSRVKLLIGIRLLPQAVEHIAFYGICRTSWRRTRNAVEGYYAMLWKHCAHIGVKRVIRSCDPGQEWNPNPQEHNSNEENHTSSNIASLLEGVLFFYLSMLIRCFLFT